MAKKKNSNNYINSEKFTDEMRTFKAACLVARENGQERPPIPRYVGECILLIANKLASSKSFSQYSFKDDMISDGIENSIRYIENFDPDRKAGIPLKGTNGVSNSGGNPFSYFTQIIYFAFLRKIFNERKELYAKHKIMSNQIATYDALAEEDKSVMAYSSLENDKLNDLVESFEKTLKTKKEKRKKMLESKNPSKSDVKILEEELVEIELEDFE
jgi:hypothetical protein